MKKFVSLTAVALLALTMVALAEGSGDKTGDKTIVGTVSQVDSTARSMTVKDSTGNSVVVYWNDATKLDTGMPQEGSTVSVTIDSKDSGAKPMAKSISIQPKKPY
jgi:hypothetical protein